MSLMLVDKLKRKNNQLDVPSASPFAGSILEEDFGVCFIYD